MVAGHDGGTRHRYVLKAFDPRPERQPQQWTQKHVFEHVVKRSLSPTLPNRLWGRVLPDFIP